MTKHSFQMLKYFAFGYCINTRISHNVGATEYIRISLKIRIPGSPPLSMFSDLGGVISKNLHFKL